MHQKQSAATTANGATVEAGLCRNLIFDIGMNICEDTDFYLKKGFRVIAVEANPVTCRAAAAKYRDAAASGQLTIVNAAIARSRDPLTFYVCNSDAALSTASPRLRDFWQARGATFEAIEVPGLPPADLVAAHGIPYYAKIDIEGSDLLCLEAFEHSAIKPSYVSLEVDFYSVDEMLGRLQSMGYRRFALVGQKHVREQRAPQPPREGRYVDYRFEHSSSGLFGRELPDAWCSDETIRHRCRQIIRQYRFSGLLEQLDRFVGTGAALANARARFFPLAGDWYDLHAAFA